MVTHRSYAKAPITEAVIDIRISHDGERRITDLASLASPLDALGYSQQRVLQEAIGEFRLGPQVGASAQTLPVGYLFSGEEGRNLLQVRVNGFALSRLTPYTNWSSFREEARRLFSLYWDVTTPSRLTRLAVRYINRFDLPSPPVEVNQFFTLRPEAPETIRTMTGFYMQLRVDQDDIMASALINQALVEPTTPNVASVILDIDVFRTEEIGSYEEIWPLLDVLRNREYLIFESSITDKARELIS